MNASVLPLRRIVAMNKPEYPDPTSINRILIAVIDEASRIEPDAATLLRWYVEDPIQQLGGLTASQLVAAGRGELVIRFLRRVTSTGRFR